MDNDQKLHSNDEKDRLKLRDVLSQEIPEDQEVTRGRDCILIATVALCMLYYAKNQHFYILQVMAGYFAYINNTTKRIVENLYYMGFLVIYKTVR